MSLFEEISSVEHEATSKRIAILCATVEAQEEALEEAKGRISRMEDLLEDLLTSGCPIEIEPANPNVPSFDVHIVDCDSEKECPADCPTEECPSGECPSEGFSAPNNLRDSARFRGAFGGIIKELIGEFITSDEFKAILKEIVLAIITSYLNESAPLEMRDVGRNTPDENSVSED